MTRRCDHMGERLEGERIFIVEDEPLIALDLETAIIDNGGTVLGPAGSLAQASSLMSDPEIKGAILDVNLRDGVITPLATHLGMRGIPIVFHTGHAGEMVDILQSISGTPHAVIEKPALTENVIAALIDLLRR